MHPTHPARVALVLTLFCTTVAAAQTAEPRDVTKPTLVTLKHDNAPPKQVFDDLANQLGVKFSPANFFDKNPGQPISVAADAQPFWLAMKDACGKANLSLKYATDSADPVVILSRNDNQDWTKFPTVTDGPFLVSLIGLHRSTTIDMRKPTEVQKSFYAKFTVFAEPRFRLLRASLGAKVVEAVDDKGNALIPKGSPAEQPLNFVTSWVYNLEGKLDYPKEPGTRIASLKATARFIAQTKSEQIEISDPLTTKDVTKVVAGRKVTIREVRRAPEEYEARVTFARGEVPAAEWEQAIFPGNALRLVDNAGKSINARGFGLGGKGDESTYVFKFEREPPTGSRIGKPAKLVWDVPTATAEIPLTIEFRDLPMP